MKMKFKILYKNGIEDEIVQEGTEDEIGNVLEILEKCFKEDLEGVVTLGDGIKNGLYVRLSDVSRVGIQLIEE